MENTENKKSRKAVRVVLLLLLCLLLFAAGVGTGLFYSAYLRAQEPPSCTIEGHIPSQAVQVRVDGGVVEWFDGQNWNPVSGAEELSAQDRFQLARESYRAFEDQLIEKLNAQSAAAEEPADGEEAGESEEETVVSPVELPQTGRKIQVYTGGGGGDGGGGGGGPSDGGGGGGGGGYSGGDGENIGWSSDYL